MKHIYYYVQGFCMVIFLSLTPVFAQQSNPGFSYQAVVRNPDGSKKVNEQIAINFKIFQGLPANGVQVFSEVKTMISNEHGIVTTMIGENSLSFAQINWETGQVYMEVWIGNQKVDQVTFGTVPYSEVSKVATDMTIFDLKDIGGATPSTGQTLIWNGLQWQAAFPIGSSLWNSGTGGAISYNLGTVNIGKPIGSAFNYALDIAGTANIAGAIYLRDYGDALYISDPAHVSTGGNSVTLGTLSGAGFLRQRGPNGMSNAFLGGNATWKNHGAFALSYSDGDIRTWMTVLSAGQGYFHLDGANGNSNIRLTTPVGQDNNGYITVLDGAGTEQAGLYVNAAGQGILFKDVSNFRMDHPEQEGKEIWYACIEGPEAAAYERGTAELINGETFVPFSDHFELVANPESVTIILTPLDASSEGMAVVEKRQEGFVVRELRNGSGSYHFDWEVKAVRKGYEDYRVIRDADETSSEINVEDTHKGDTE